MNKRYTNPDKDINGMWKSTDSSAMNTSKNGTFGIQSPFTGIVHYPRSKLGSWAYGKEELLKEINKWNVEYEMIPTKDFFTVKYKNKVVSERLYIYAIKGWDFDNKLNNKELLKKSKLNANKILENGDLPKFYWGIDGKSSLRMKSYLSEVKQGKVPITFWSEDDLHDESFLPIEIDSVSWRHEESGHSQAGINELDSIIGKGHGFDTVKPLKLIKKIITLWCNPDGLILDPFAGSGTTAHACLELNNEHSFDRKFILIEQGNTEKNDLYAETLTAQRIKNIIDGQWILKKKNQTINAIDSGFTYQKLNKKVDEEAVKNLAKEELIDVLTSSYWNTTEKAKSYLLKNNNEKNKFLFAKNNRNEGFYLVWIDNSITDLTKSIFKEIIQEAKDNELIGRYHIYATGAIFTSPTIEFYKIPDKVLEQLGFNENILDN